MPAAKTTLHVENDVTGWYHAIIAHWPRRVVTPKLIALFDAYEKCAAIFDGSLPFAASLHLREGREIRIRIHPAGDGDSAQDLYERFVDLGQSLMEILAGEPDKAEKERSPAP